MAPIADLEIESTTDQMDQNALKAYFCRRRAARRWHHGPAVPSAILGPRPPLDFFGKTPQGC